MSEQETQKKVIRLEKSKKQKSDQIHIIISLTLVIMSYVFYSNYTAFRKKAPKLGVEMRSMGDLGWSVLAAVVIHLARRLLDLVLRGYLEKRLKDDNLPDLDLRRDKVTRNVFDAFYYFGIYLFGRFVASGLEIVPSCVGGAGACMSLGSYWPNIPLYPMMRIYIIIQFGHHLHNLVYHTFAMRNVGNYFEMITHHYATVISIFYSYFTNWEDYAFIILISHDLSDGFLNLGKVARDLKVDWLVSLSYVFMTFFWMYHRIILAMCHFWKSSEFWNMTPPQEYLDLWTSVKYGVRFITSNIYVIWLLNVWWWIQIVKIGINRFLRKREWVSQHEGELDPEEIKRKAEGSSGTSPVDPKASEYPVSPSQCLSIKRKAD